jgi:Cu-Zn family superoxide dismutase
MEKAVKPIHWAVLAAITMLASSAHAQTATTELKDADGKTVGIATLTQVPQGVLIALSLKGLPAGEHAVHFHAVGKCEPPFTTAGAHFNPTGKKHGFLAAEGAHSGDMPNLHVPASGELSVEIVNTAVTLDKGKPNSLLDGDGTSLVIHAAKDDYKTDPAGDSGARIACAVIH